MALGEPPYETTQYPRVRADARLDHTQHTARAQMQAKPKGRQAKREGLTRERSERPAARRRVGQNKNNFLTQKIKK